MYLEKRPTCITVIGWTWIILGGLMCLAATMAIIVTQVGPEFTQHEQDVPIVVKFFPLLAFVQASVGLLATISGINFLKLKKWSRHVLEVLTWLMLLYVVGFGVFWIYASLSSVEVQDPFEIGFAVMGIIITSIYVVPLIIMLKYLRGSKVKNAITVSTESDSANNPPRTPNYRKHHGMIFK